MNTGKRYDTSKSVGILIKTALADARQSIKNGTSSWDMEMLQDEGAVINILNGLLFDTFTSLFEPHGYSVKIVCTSAGDPASLDLLVRDLPLNHAISRKFQGRNIVNHQVTFGKLAKTRVGGEEFYNRIVPYGSFAMIPTAELLPACDDFYLAAFRPIITRIDRIREYMSQIPAEDHPRFLKCVNMLFVEAPQMLNGPTGAYFEEIMDPQWYQDLQNEIDRVKDSAKKAKVVI